jgi:hypothetical protein
VQASLRGPGRFGHKLPITPGIAQATKPHEPDSAHFPDRRLWTTCPIRQVDRAMKSLTGDQAEIEHGIT